MNSPRNVLPFKGLRRSYEEELRKQQEAKQLSPVHESLKRIKHWLDSGADPKQIAAFQANRSRALIQQEAKALSEYTTPAAAAAYLMKLAEQMMGEKP